MSQHFEKDELLSLDNMQPACNKKVVSLAFAQSFNLFHFTLFHKFCELKEVLAFLMKAIHHSSIQRNKFR
jgi:hypothetical protein